MFMGNQVEPCVSAFQQVAERLVDEGYCIIENALPEALCQALFQRVTSLPRSEFRRAGIGRNRDQQIDDGYRTDEIHWLDSCDASASAYLTLMEQLRLDINRQLFIGLFDYEAHFAHYAPGSFYKRHLDAFQGNTNRVVTTVFYLNPEWCEQDGGAINLYENTDSEIPFKSVFPKMGTLVVFLSDQFPHEVMAAQRDRYSIAGWFRVKAAGVMVDPPR